MEKAQPLLSVPHGAHGPRCTTMGARRSAGELKNPDFWENGRVGDVQYLRVKGLATSIPDYVLKDICLVNEGEVIKGFKFSPNDEKPKIIYDLADTCGLYCYGVEKDRGEHFDGDLSYARVITKNLCYTDLVKTIAHVGMDCLDEYSHMSFIAIVFKLEVKLNQMRSVKITEMIAFWVFVIVYITASFLQLWLAYDRTVIEWSQEILAEEGGTQETVADIILSCPDRHYEDNKPTPSFKWCPCCIKWCCCCFYLPIAYSVGCVKKLCTRTPKGRLPEDKFQRLHWYNEKRLFSQMVFMEYFGVHKRVSNLLIHAHPFKKMMPWAAIRKEKARAILIGYKDKSMYYYEDQSGSEWSISLDIVKKFLLMVTKIYIWSKIGILEDVFQEIITVFPTAACFYMKALRLKILVHNRGKFKNYLVKTLREEAETSHDYKMAAKLFEKYFSPKRLATRISTYVFFRGQPDVSTTKPHPPEHPV